MSKHEKHSISRRTFVGGALAATGAVALGLRQNRQAEAQTAAIVPPLSPAQAALLPKKPSDQVMLGNTGLKVSLVGLGTGSIGSGGGSNQTRLGIEGFNRLMRHGFDNGITLFDMADSYGSNAFFARAMRGVPRDQYVIQTKTDNRDPNGARADIDRFLRELETDHIDSVLVHCVTEADWTTRYEGVLQVLEDAKKAGKIRAHGVSCHSFQALQAALQSDWVETHLVRWNARRSHMDAAVPDARAIFLSMRAKGQGLIGMKVMGEGSLLRGKTPMTPEECVRFQIESGVTHAFVVGAEKTEHIDQMLKGAQTALDEFRPQAL